MGSQVSERLVLLALEERRRLLEDDQRARAVALASAQQFGQESEETPLQRSHSMVGGGTGVAIRGKVKRKKQSRKWRRQRNKLMVLVNTEVMTMQYSLPSELSEEDRSLLDKSVKKTGAYMWVHTMVFPRQDTKEQHGQRHSILVDSGNPLPLLMSRQQLPKNCILVDSKSYNIPIMRITICECTVTSTERAIVTIQLGELRFRVVATVYDERDLKGRQLPPILGFQFLKDNKIGINLSPTTGTNNWQQKRSTIRLDTADARLLTTARVKCGCLTKLVDDIPTELAKLFETTKINSTRQFTLLTKTTDRVNTQCHRVDPEDEPTFTTTVSSELLQPLRMQLVKVDASMMHDLKKDDLVEIDEPTETELRRSGVLVLPGVVDITRSDSTATIVVLNTNCNPIRIAAGTPIATIAKYDETQEIKDTSDKPIRFAFIEGKLCWVGDSEARAKLLLAEATAKLFSTGIWDPNSPEGREGVRCLQQHALIGLMEAEVDVEDPEAVQAYLDRTSEELDQQICNKEPGTARVLGLKTGLTRTSVSTTRPTTSGESTSTSRRQAAPRQPAPPSPPPQPPPQALEETDTMTEKLTRCPPPFLKEVDRLPEELKAKVRWEITSYRNMSQDMEQSGGVSQPSGSQDVQRTVAVADSTEEVPTNAVVEDALRVQDDTQQREYTAADVHLPEVQEKLKEMLEQSPNLMPDTLTEDQRKQVLDLVYEYADRFVNTVGFSGPSERAFEIDLQVSEPEGPFKCHQIPLSLKSKAIVRQILEQYLKRGIVERSQEKNWTSPVFVMFKGSKGASEEQRNKLSNYRVLSDLRFLNSHIRNNLHSTTVPLIKQLFTKFEGASWAALFDLTSGYTQLKLSKRSRHYTAFTAPPPLGRLQFRRCPQGLAFLPGAFMDIMHRILGSMSGASVLVYLDDMTVIGNSFTDLLQNVRQLFDRLREHNMVISLKKSTIGTQCFDFLGHRFDLSRSSNRGVMVQHKKVEAILQTPVPTNVGELRGILGQYTYYSDFIPGFASIAAPLHSLTSTSPSRVVIAGPPERVNNEGTAAHAHEVKMSESEMKSWKLSQKKKKGRLRKQAAKQAFIWDDAVHGAAFRLLKRVLTQDVVLKIHSCHPDALLRIRTDASNTAIGSVLEQLVIDGPLIGRYRPIAFTSSKLSPVQCRWSATERECFAIIRALEGYHQFICGRPVSVYCDHRALQYVFSPDYQCSGSTRGRLFRWRARAARYSNVELYYVPGTLMEKSGPDLLSRIELDQSIRAEPRPLLDLLGELDPPEDEIMFLTQTDQQTDDNTPTTSSVQINVVRTALAQTLVESAELWENSMYSTTPVEQMGLLANPDSLWTVVNNNTDRSTTEQSARSCINTTGGNAAGGSSNRGARRQRAPSDENTVGSETADVATVRTRAQRQRDSSSSTSGGGTNNRKQSLNWAPQAELRVCSGWQCSVAAWHHRVTTRMYTELTNNMYIDLQFAHSLHLAISSTAAWTDASHCARHVATSSEA